jgi:hypothetical protein
MHKLVFFFALNIVSIGAFSQSFNWVKTFGGSSLDYGHSSSIDGNGNLYTTGQFLGTVDFDPGAGTTNLTGSGNMDIFITKFDLSGNFIWARNMGGTANDYGYSIVTDDTGNVYITGYFEGTCDFDPGAATYNLSALGIADIFVCKLSPAGDLVWATRIGSSGSDQGLAIDHGSANIYITGNYSNTVDFDPGAGINNLTTASSSVFVLCLNTDGIFNWAKSLGGANPNSISVDHSGNVITTGYHVGGDFDPGPGVFNLPFVGNSDCFVSKLNSSGDFVWAANLAGAGTDEGYEVTTDLYGNVYVTGYFESTADFDPGPGNFNLVSGAERDLFVVKLDSTAQMIWAIKAGAEGYEAGRGIITDLSGNVYVTGSYQSTVDFDPDTSSYELTSVGQNDIFILKLNPNGTFNWLQSMGGTQTEWGEHILLDNAGGIYTTGSFQYICDFEPGIGTTNANSNGSYDVFMLKLFDASSSNIENIQTAEINVYPNPFINSLTINGSVENMQVRLYNSHGNVVGNWLINENNHTITTENLPTGIYFLGIQTPNGITTKKIIKQ